ncbi:hypothetical protein HDV04_004973 [Boothiomyces sp. JEL0838]|nr:hypothetical protein HDV04_004973 [Boothiomyces sp. JEL0838]
MPPKSKKAAIERKQKIVEDKTFGLKNKNKSSKVKKYVEEVTKQVHIAGDRKQREAQEKARQDQLMRKKMEEEKKKEMAELFNSVIIQQKVPFGVDPKTVLCAHFKAGKCQKGDRCKFSHDLNVERKSQKANIYQDVREESKEDKEKDTMENWDQTKLEDAIKQRESGRENLNRATEIVCKYFIEAIETQKYGWFWDCPNGVTCKYRHALPPGFVLKKKETEQERREREEYEKKNEITIEEFLEKERHSLGPNLTPVTAESFAKWKAERTKRHELVLEEQNRSKKEAMARMKAGQKTGMKFSGKDMFDFNPDWANEGDDDAMDEYIIQEQDDEMEISRGVSAASLEDIQDDQDEMQVEDIQE